VRAKRSRILSERISEKVIVTLKAGPAFEGVLWDADDRCWVLRNAEAIGAAKGGGPLPLDGEVIVLTNDILHVQRA
jgi:hypothetical protein